MELRWVVDVPGGWRGFGHQFDTSQVRDVSRSTRRRCADGHIPLNVREYPGKLEVTGYVYGGPGGCSL